MPPATPTLLLRHEFGVLRELWGGRAKEEREREREIRETTQEGAATVISGTFFSKHIKFFTSTIDKIIPASIVLITPDKNV